MKKEQRGRREMDEGGRWREERDEGRWREEGDGGRRKMEGEGEITFFFLMYIMCS